MPQDVALIQPSGESYRSRFPAAPPPTRSWPGQLRWTRLL
jgi:hypothetical protein